jgi:hypothetical protein
MKYEVGDTILVLHSNEEGKVIEIMNEKMVMIEVRGVRFPAYMDQIDFPYFQRFTKNKVVPVTKEPKKVYIDEVKKEKPAPRQATEPGIWLSFLPVFDKDVFDDDVVEKFRLYLVNQTPDAINFSYTLMFGGAANFELKNTVSPLGDFYLHDVPFEDLNDAPRFDFEFTLAKPNKRKAPYFEFSLKLKAKQLFKKIEEIRLNNEPAFRYLLMAAYPDKPEEEKVVLNPTQNKHFRLYDLSKIGQFAEPARTMVDLHIEKLTDDPTRLSSPEILSLQLRTFEKYYDLAVRNHQSQFIVLHGVGSGRLRDEIHALLRQKRDVKSFVNQYHPMYGYGATEIFFNT